MFLDSLKQFNWVDIVILIVFVRICFVAANGGLPPEFFKLSGTLLAVYLSLHFYKHFSTVLQGYVPYLREAQLSVADSLAFISLAITGYLSFLLLRILFCSFIKMEAAPNLNRWGGLIIGIGRSTLLSGLILFMMLVTDTPYLKQSVKYSYFGARLLEAAPKAYSLIWNNFVSKFVKSQKFNQAVLKVKEGIRK